MLRNTPSTVTLLYTIEYKLPTTEMEESVSGGITLSVVKPVSLEILVPTKAKVEPGKSFSVELVVKNKGKGAAKELSLSVDTTDLPFVLLGRGSKVYIGDLPSGGEARVNLTFSTSKDAELRPYQIPLTLSYRDEFNQEKSEVASFGVEVFGSAELIAYVDEVEVHGNKAVVSIVIANSGSDSAKYLFVKLLEPSDAGPKEYYIGTLDPDDYETFEFEIPALGKMKVGLMMYYKDSYNNEYKLYRNVSLFARPILKEVKRWDVDWMVYLAIIALVLFFAFKKFKQK